MKDKISMVISGCVPTFMIMYKYKKEKNKGSRF